jgi:hypothetical protein
MKFDVYYPIRTKNGLVRPGVKPAPMEWSAILTMMQAVANTNLIKAYRTGVKDAKSQLPAICFVGECQKTRANQYMKPTQAVMLDVDHVEDPKAAYEAIVSEFQNDEAKWSWWCDNVLLWAITPSGHGLRGVVWAQPNVPRFETYDEHGLPAQMQYLNEKFNLSKYGDFDAPCKDFARISFFFDPEEILWQNAQLLANHDKRPDSIIVNYNLSRKQLDCFDGQAEKGANVNGTTDETNVQSNGERPEVCNYPVFSQEEIDEMNGLDYDGTPLLKIIEKWVELHGQPGKMKVHNYYNDMIKNFRNIMNNDPKIVFALLPRFGHTPDECWSQCTSICRTNTLSQLPKQFYFFLKDNGFYKGKGAVNSMSEYMMQENVKTEREKLPWMPPVIRELIGTAPDDFKFPLLVGLLPIMGTLTSCVGAKYYYGQNEYHTTSFFSVIYAPAGTGKGFLSAYMNLLFKKLLLAA